MSITCVLLAVALAGQTTKSPAAAKPFVSQPGGFEVNMPGKPVEQNQTVKSEIGDIDVHLYVLDKGTAAYFASYNDYPEAIGAADPKAVLDGVVTGVIQNGKLVLKKADKLGSIPGVYVEYTLPIGGRNATGRSRIFLDKTRLYQVMVLGDPAIVSSPAGNAYLDSFKVTRPVAKSATPSGPITFAPAGGRFEVKLSAKPIEQVKKLNGPQGDVDLHMYIVPAGNTAYLVGYQDSPPQANVDPDALLDMAANGGVAAVKGKTLSKKSIKLGTVPGKEVKFSAVLPGDIKSTGRIRVYLDKTRLYQVLILSDTDLATSPAGTAFLDSFKITQGK